MISKDSIVTFREDMKVFIEELIFTVLWYMVWLTLCIPVGINGAIGFIIIGVLSIVCSMVYFDRIPMQCFASGSIPRSVPRSVLRWLFTRGIQIIAGPFMLFMFVGPRMRLPDDVGKRSRIMMVVVAVYSCCISIILNEVITLYLCGVVYLWMQIALIMTMWACCLRALSKGRVLLGCIYCGIAALFYGLLVGYSAFSVIFTLANAPFISYGAYREMTQTGPEKKL
ncbi:MAG: hypothetical protein IT440_14255 [Phycisphaeraceae bacterium]|nr:hypothetical protein [Phycisphaeraceae bacterium]